MSSEQANPGEPEDNRAYLARVMNEIDEEVRARRASGDLPPRIERELDELFLAFSPVGGRTGGLREALRMVDQATFIDPVVPVASAKSGGAMVKRGLRQLSLWYVGYVTHQVSQFATAVSRSLHLVSEDLDDMRRRLDGQRVPPAPVVEVQWAHHRGAWWVPAALKALGGAPGRVLHAAAGDGWLVDACRDAGIDAYGVDPGRDVDDRSDVGTLDLRREPVASHIAATQSAALGGIVLTGVVEALAPGERAQLLELVGDRLAPDGVVVVHSLSPAEWAAADLPVEADLAVGHPLRPETWAHLFGQLGFEVEVTSGASAGGAGSARDYVVVGTLVRPGGAARR
jgi:hypothetical protein